MSITIKPPAIDASEVATDADRELTEEERRQRQIQLNKPVIALLQSWLEDDQEDSEEEQRESLRALKEGIDANRPPWAKLFS